MGANKNDPDQPTRHHIYPRSRVGDDSSNRNIAIITRAKHDEYHRMFSNLLPEEIVEFLNTNYWNNMFQITITKRPP